MGYTDIYNLGYLEPYQEDYALDLDERRFRAMEAQLLGIYTLFGNGVLESSGNQDTSWRLVPNPDDLNGETVLITSGRGHIEWKIAESLETYTQSIPQPPGAVTEAIFYIYAFPNEDTHDQMSVSFEASLVQRDEPNFYIGLGAVHVDYTTSPATITCYNDADHGRVVISLFSALASIINRHKHIGGANNPSPIDLGLHVQGKLSGDNIDNLDLSTVTRGNLAPERLPLIDHDTGLTRNGTLTHSQIESLLAMLLTADSFRLSDYTTANMLQLGLALKKQSGLASIDEKLINAILYVPGITDTDFEATGIPGTIPLATIDYTLHQIRGTNAAPANSDMVIWNTELDFGLALDEAELRTVSKQPEPENIIVTGSGLDGSITIDKPVNYAGKATIDLTDWVSGTTLTDSATKTGGLPVDNFQDNYNLRRYFILEFDEEDWSETQKLGLCFSVDASAEPGDIYFFLILEEGGTTKTMRLTSSGAEKSFDIGPAVQVLDSTDASPTSQYIVENLSNLVSDLEDLEQVSGFGFYWETGSGWDSNEVNFALEVPTSTQINDTRVNTAREAPEPPLTPDVTSTIFIWNDALFAPSGTLVFRFDSNSTSTLYNVVNWDETLPTGTTITIETRVADSEVNLSNTASYEVFSDLNSVDTRGRRGRWIDIIVTLNASSDLLDAPVVEMLSLSYTGPGAAVSKIWERDYSNETYDQTGWYDGGRTLTNITVSAQQGGSEPYTNYLYITDTNKVGQFLYLREDGSYASYAVDGSDEGLYPESGLSLYKSPVQEWEKSTTGGLNNAWDMVTLADGNIVFADTENDRVVQVDASGVFVKAIQGNIRLNTISRDLAALTAVYNSRLETLWIAFSQNILFDRSKIFVRSGDHSIALSDTGVNIVLFDPIDGKSATIEVTFSTTLAARINAWIEPMQVILTEDSITASGTSGGGDTGGTGGTGGDTGSGGQLGGLSFGTLSDDDCLPTGLYSNLGTGNFEGSLACAVGLDEEEVDTGDSTDFDDDGEIGQTLLGPSGQSGRVVLDVTRAEIVFDNLLNPVSIHVNDIGHWIVAAVGDDSVISYGTLGDRLWEIPTTLISMQLAKGGSAYEIDESRVLVAAPAGTDGKGTVMVVNRASSNLPVTTLLIQGDAVKAIPASDIEYWVAIDDTSNDGLSSRVVKINSSGRVLWTWGTGTLVHPSGMKLLSNGDLIISE